MPLNHSETYKSLPGSIASTIPRRTSFRDSWQPGATLGSLDRKRDQGSQSDGVHRKLKRESESIKRKSILFQEPPEPSKLVGSVVSGSDQGDAICVTGQVKKHAQFFEKIPEREECEAPTLGRQPQLKTVGDSNSIDVIKYKVRSPYWDQYNNPKPKVHRHTVSNFPKWDAICKAQVESHSHQVVRHETDDIPGSNTGIPGSNTGIPGSNTDGIKRVHSLKVKLFNSLQELEKRPTSKAKSTDNGGKSDWKSIKKSSSSAVACKNKCITISEPVLVNTSKLSVKPLIKPRSLITNGKSLSPNDSVVKRNQPVKRRPTSFLSNRGTDNKSQSIGSPSQGPGRCAEQTWLGGGHLTNNNTTLSDRSDSVEVGLESDAVLSVVLSEEKEEAESAEESSNQVSRYQEEQESVDDSDASVCTVIRAKETEISSRVRGKKDDIWEANENMVSDVGCPPPMQNKTTMGASDMNEDHLLTGASNGTKLELERPSGLKTPRIVAASLKSYKDIPEDLFNSLPESSVDPGPIERADSGSPDGDVVPQDGGVEEAPRHEQDWVVMQEGRRALLETSVLSNHWVPSSHDGDSISDGRSSSLSTCSDRTGTSLPSRFGSVAENSEPSPSAAIRSQFRGFCSTMMEDSVPGSHCGSVNTSFETETSERQIVPLQTIKSKENDLSFPGEVSQFFSSINDTHCTEPSYYDNVCFNDTSRIIIQEESLSDTERKLREAGVYFRLPSPVSRKSAKYTPGGASGTNKLSMSTEPSATGELPCISNRRNDPGAAEVNDALQSLDTTLAKYSSGGSSRSSSGSESSPSVGGVREAKIATPAAGGSSGKAAVSAPKQSDGGSEGVHISRIGSEEGGFITSLDYHKFKECGSLSDVDDRGELRGSVPSDDVLDAKQHPVNEGNRKAVMSVKFLAENYENTTISGQISNSSPVVTICPYSERGRLGPFKLDKTTNDANLKKKSVQDLKHNFRNTKTGEMKLNRDSIMEPLNLIEEVYVPESSVTMRAFFPTVEFSARGSGNLNKAQVRTGDSERTDKTHGRSGDSDSGHGSGATSPCGTLTDPPSPPPSPPDSRLSHRPPGLVQHTVLITPQAQIIERQTQQIHSTVAEVHNSPPNVNIDTRNQHVSILTCSPVGSSEPSPGQPLVNSPTSSSQSSGVPQGMILESAVVGQCDVGLDEVTVTTTQPRESNHFVVVAIDFGTTYSGYAFSFTRDPDSVHMMKKWEGGDPGVQNQKTPTIVLLTPDNRFHSLGFSARDHYHDLEPKEAAKWLYFDKFKMELHDDRSLSRDSLLVAANGQKVPALEIFSHALRYFRDHALRELCDLAVGTHVTEEDVRWVLTVPAIWSHPAKQFMRTAAYMAGLGSLNHPEQLLIALEPEAAAIYCRKLHRHQLVPARSTILRTRNTSTESRPISTPSGTYSKKHQISLGVESPSSPVGDCLDMSPGRRPYSTGFATVPSPRHSRVLRQDEENMDEGVLAINQDEEHLLDMTNSETVSDWLVQDTVYMVVDCGGGTVDITVHQMTDTKAGHLKELHKATGGPYGSTGVDKEFEKLLDKIFTADFMSSFKQQRPAAFVDLMIAFESRKRNASLYRSNPLNIALPFSFIDMYKKTKGKDVESAVRKHGTALGVQWSSQGMLRASQDTMRGLFSDTLDKIQQSIESVLSLLEREASTGSSSALQFLFLVGGFSESELLQQHIRDAFSDRVTVVIPQGMGLAILRGAVQFGLDPSVVTVRRSRLTYGVGVLNRWQEGLHPPEKRVFAAGSDWCADVLDVFVRVDESVALGDVVSRSYTPATARQSTVVLHLYATHDTKAMHFVSDAGVQRVGTLHLDLRDTWTTVPSVDNSEHCCSKQCCCCSKLCGQASGPALDAEEIKPTSNIQREEDTLRGSSHRVENAVETNPDPSEGSTANVSFSSSCQKCHQGSDCDSHKALCRGGCSSKGTVSSRDSPLCGGPRDQRREISVHLKFGDTEVKASAVDHLTGKCVKANFDFLSL